MQPKMMDTFPIFQGYWLGIRDSPVSVQIERWLSDYMSHWPELLDKQLSDYADQQLDWRKIAAERVFPFLNSRLDAMKTARSMIRTNFSSITRQAGQKLRLETEITCVIYVGIGCGAGWATTYAGLPSVLFGLENIAECGWDNQDAIRGLIAHELGHIIHALWRKQAGVPEGSGPWWQLYTEGFAQRCEHLILGEDTWHEAGKRDHQWLRWCKEHRAELASEFLARIAERQDIRPFFGSWYEISGHAQTGYFLGHEAIKKMGEAGMNIREIGILEDPDIQLQALLDSLASE